MITMDGITKRYADVTVLDDVSLTIPDRSLTALVGPNGAGKSTLLSIASRLLPTDAGTVRLDELDVLRARDTEVAQRLAVLRQDNRVAARLTVVDLVRFGRFPYCKGRLRAEDHACVAEALAYMELDDLRDRYLDQLSGGQRQRAFIAMVLAQDTDHVLLDEPLNNLDMRHAVQMMRRLRALVDERGKTVVVVLHDINFAAAHADHVVAMRDGRVIAAGTPEEIVCTDVLRSVYDLDVPVHHVENQPVAVYFS